MIDRNLRPPIYKAAAHIYVMLNQLKSSDWTFVLLSSLFLSIDTHTSAYIWQDEPL